MKLESEIMSSQSVADLRSESSLGWLRNMALSLSLPVVPKRAMSRQVGRLARVQKPHWLAHWAMAAFARHYRLDMSEAEKPLADYQSLDELFTRKLKANVRPLGEGVIHPVDGCLTQMGLIHEGQLIQAKGRTYRLAEFLRSPKLAHAVADGFYLTYYLCPTDYHRVHSATTGEIDCVHYIPGKLWPVNDWSVNRIQNLFSVNERVVVSMKTEGGPVAAVLVGATNVGKISLSFDPKVTTNIERSERELTRLYSPPVPIRKGEELGVFHMGSSVVMLYSKAFLSASLLDSPIRLDSQIRLDPQILSSQILSLGQSVKMGQSLLS